MSATVSPNQSQVFTALVGALGMFGLIPTNPAQPVTIIRGQVNRVPEPLGADFVVLWPIGRDPLANAIEEYADVQVTGSIGGASVSGAILTISGVIAGLPAAGQTIYGAGVTAGCRIVRQLTGPPGGAGDYATTPCATVAAQTLYLGTVGLIHPTEITVQADIHGPSSADNIARIAALFPKQFGVEAFAAQGIALAPLYTGIPRQSPFDNAEQQVEERWTIDLCMEAHVIVTTTMQFADKVKVGLIEVDAAYPPGA